MRSWKKYEEFKVAVDVWANAVDRPDAFKVGYLQSLAATMYAKLPPGEREHFLAVLKYSTARCS